MADLSRSVLRGCLAAALVVFGFVIVPVMPAQAHQDGCHRWHSCPSDTGSYVCGDTGHYSECPGGEPDAGSDDEDATPAPEMDYDPPRQPRITDVKSAAGGHVTLHIRAEKGSTIKVVTDTGHRVAKVTATGADQRIKFRAKTGRRTYSVTATDKADNESDQATKTVKVDATAPKLSHVTAVAGTGATGASTVSFVSDAGAEWTLTGGGLKARRGTAQEATTNLVLWLKNGTYRPTLTVRDRIGNTRRHPVHLRIHVTKPLLHVERTSPDASKTMTYAVTGTPRSTGKLVLRHLKAMPFRIDSSGATAVTADLADGTYGPGRILLTDFAGRTTEQPLPALIVDTTPPQLELTADQEQAQAGSLAVTVTAEAGTTLHVNADLHGATVDETATATTTPFVVQRGVGTGSYTVTATAQDAAGNTTTRKVDVNVVVPAAPTTASDVVLGSAILLLLLGLPVVGAVVAWKRRRQIGAWRRRRAELAQQRAAERAAAAAEAAHQQQLIAYQQAYANYRAADAHWEREHQQLRQLADFVRNFQPASEGAPVPLKSGETHYGTFPATMVEQRTRQNIPTLIDIGPGGATITNRRVLFAGAKNRDWTYANLQRVTNQASGVTLISVSNRKQASGLSLTAAAKDAFRLRLDLALADASGTRAPLIAHHHQAIQAHQQRRPKPPQPPVQPPTLR